MTAPTVASVASNYRDGSKAGCISYSASFRSFPSSFPSGYAWQSCPLSAYVSGTVAAAPPSNTSLPVISGTPQQGQTLTASSGTWTGNPTSYSYAWSDGAQGASDMLTAADVGKIITITVTASNTAGWTIATSAGVGPVTALARPANSALPTITGAAQQGQALAATTGTWTNSPTSYTYQWQDCNLSGTGCVNITGATNSTYTITSSDAGDTIVVVVTATNSAGSTSQASSPTGMVPGSAPANSAPPTITGAAQQGQTLAATTGTWTNSPTSYTYQWQDCNTSGNNCVNAAGSPSTSQTYTIVNGDNGDTIRVVVTATNAGGSASQTSAATGVVSGSGSAPVEVSEPVASGDVATGNTVSTTSGSWSNSPTGYTYQWQRCATDGSACTNISTATSQTYTVQSSDSGDVLRAQVTASNGAGSATPAPSTMIPFGDVFVNDSAVDTNLWNIIDRHGDSTQSELECYVPGGVSITGDQLALTATAQTVNPCPYGQGQATTTANYASGEVQAKNFDFRYGTIRAKMQFSCASGSGCWPAFWSYDASLCQWPNNLDNCPGFARDEIDYAENTYDGGSNLIQDEDVYTVGAGWRTCYPSVTATQSHIYEFDWTPSSIVFKIDGVNTGCTVSSSLPTTPQVLIYNLAMGGNGGSINKGVLPTSAKMDWVYVTTDSPFNTSPPTLSGTLTHGNVISMTNGTWASGQSCSSGLTCTHKWLHCNPGVTGSGYCSAIGGATGSSYTLKTGDVGNYVEGVITATNANGGAASAATGLSAAVN